MNRISACSIALFLGAACSVGGDSVAALAALPGPAISLATAEDPIEPIPLHIELDERKVSLGEKLFADKSFSADGTLACMSCHLFNYGAADTKAYSVGINGAPTAVNSPTMFNVAFNYRFNWNGKYTSLEEHMDAPLLNPRVMGARWDSVVKKLVASPDYVARFQAIYAQPPSVAGFKDAMVAYETSLYTPNCRLDQYLRGDKNALTAEEKEGYAIFKGYGCISCHQGINVGGNMMQRFGVMRDYFADRGDVTDADLGRFLVTSRPEDRYVFRVPSLRNVALTAPYFHDGSADTLEDAVSVMGRYQLGRPLSAHQVQVVVAFLGTLTGTYKGKPL